MLVTDLSNSFHPVPKPKNSRNNKKTAEKSGQIKKKSSKLAKLENNRFSIITNNLEKCYLCSGIKIDLHEIFGGRNRKKSMQYGLVIPVCRKCHGMIPKDKTLNENLHKVGQKVFEKHYKTENFIQIFGRNYL